MNNGQKRTLLVISDWVFDRNVLSVFVKRRNIDKIIYFEKVLGQFTGRRILYRHLMYFVLALKGYLYYSRRNPDFVLIWQQYIGLYFSLFSLFDITRISRMKKSKIVLFSIIPKRKRLFRIFGHILDRGIINKLVYCSIRDFREAASKKKVLFKYFHKPLSAEVMTSIAVKPIIPGEYVFSGGTSNRNYSQIERLAAEFPLKKFVVACTSRDVKNIGERENVIKYTSMYGNNL